MNKKGQMGLGLMTGLIISIFVFILLSSLLPVIVQMVGNGKGSDSANCIGYVDPNEDALGINNHSYNANLDTDTITCSILDFTPGMIVLSIVFAIISGLISGRMAMSSYQEPQYSQYG